MNLFIPFVHRHSEDDPIWWSNFEDSLGYRQDGEQVGRRMIPENPTNQTGNISELDRGNVLHSCCQHLQGLEGRYSLEPLEPGNKFSIGHSCTNKNSIVPFFNGLYFFDVNEGDDLLRTLLLKLLVSSFKIKKVNIGIYFTKLCSLGGCDGWVWGRG